MFFVFFVSFGDKRIHKIRDTIVINQKFDYLYTENGRLMAVVLDENGNPDKKDVTPGRSFTQALITDGKGDTLVVSKKGQVMGVKEYQFAGDNRHLLNEYHRQLDSLGEWIIQFDAFDKQDYGFDKVSNKKGIFSGAEYYPYLSANYDLRYKSVETGKSDKVKVDFGSYPEKDSVIFKDKYGVTLKLSKKNLLTFTAPNQADTNYIYAYRGDKKIGKLMLNVYKKKPIKVCLVMVNGAKHKESFDEIQKHLNKVFKPAVVEFEILHADFKMSELTSFSHGGSPWNSVYNDDQKRVLRAYNDSIKDGVYYLFFIDNVTDKKDGNGTMVSGYMPRGYNCGFIYDGGSPHTIAHELGHGIAGLEHVFSDSKSSGKTKNLMDYSEGEELWHFQWDAIQDPSRVWMKWNKSEEEGESYFLNSVFYAVLNSEETSSIYDNDIVYSSQKSNDIISFGGVNSKIDYNILNKVVNLKCNIADYLENHTYLNANLQKIKFINRDTQNFVLNKDVFPVEFVYDSTKIKWRFCSDSTIIEQRNCNFSVSKLTTGEYNVKLILSEGAVKLKISYVDDNNSIKYALLQLDSTFDISFSLFVFEKPIVDFLPFDIENYYKKFGFDDAKNKSNQQAGIYDKIMISDVEYYVPWLFVDDTVSAELKIKLSLSDDFVLNNKRRKKDSLYLKFQCSSCEINGNPLSSDIHLNKLNSPLCIKLNREIKDTIKVYTQINNNKILSGKLAMLCKKEKICSKIKFIIVKKNDTEIPNVDIKMALNTINEYYKQANIKFIPSENFIDTLRLSQSSVFNCSSAQNKYERFEKNTIHIFICDKENGTQNGAGMFPSKQRNFGIAYVNFCDNYVTIVHEIGHCLGLPHTFEKECSSDKNCMKPITMEKYSTKNIMDYFENKENRKYLFKNQIEYIYGIEEK